jgi:hypothetical protein
VQTRVGKSAAWPQVRMPAQQPAGGFNGVEVNDRLLPSPPRPGTNRTGVQHWQ